MTTFPPPSDPEAERPPASSSGLSGQQRALYEALAEKHESLGVMYMGAVAVRPQDSNPDRFAQAAHSVRELMEKLPRYLDVPVLERELSMKEKLRQLEDIWDRAQGDATGVSITATLKKFLASVKEFFDWFREQHPRRRERTARVMRSLDPGTSKLPSKIEDLRLKEWDACHGFFQGVSHHTTECTEDDLDAWIDSLERFLLDRLRPRTFEDHDELDEIIAEGESRA